MHNNIMTAGLRDRPPMLAKGRYAQWQSHFMRYIDTRPNTQPATDDSPAVEEQTVLETLSNISPENKAHYDAEKEAIHLILTGIGDEIYSIIDACKIAHEMWIAIESQCSVFFNTSPEWSRFMTVVKQTVDLDQESYHKLFDILKQYQKEVDEIHAEKIAMNANPLALIAKPITPPSESASEEYSDPEQAKRDKDMQKNFALITKYFRKIYKSTNNNLKTSSNTRNKNVNTSPRYKNDNQAGQFENQRTVTVVGARETVGTQIQEVHTTDSGPSFNAEPLEEVDSNVIPDSSDMCNNENQSDQNAEECDDERVSALEECKSSLENSNRTQDTCIIALQNKEIELEKYKNYHNRTLEHDTLEHQLKETLGLLAQKEHDVKEGLKIKACEISVVKEKHDELVKQCLLTKSRYEDAHTKLQCLYHHKIKECECLAEKLSKQTKTVSKEVYNELSRSFAKLEKHTISLELALQQCQEQMKNDTVCKQNASTVFLKEREQYFKIQDLKAQLQDKNIEITIINQPVVRQPSGYKSERSQFPKHQSASKVDVSHSLTKPVTPHSWPQVRKSSFTKPYDVNAPSPSRNRPKHVSFQSPRESVGSNDMIHNYYLDEAKNKAQLHKYKALNTKPSVHQSARLPNTRTLINNLGIGHHP
ncbi:hypothetical protein Tco_0772164 [Tanacetum coccineum]|uniref:Uncharacterized protein n=1 Tax=Tanacetum coccineum TaxID=301880 RepID=A0ABQ4ZL42_9ASTR